MDADEKERYRRWEHYRITQLSFSINLFLTFAVASLAFIIHIKLGDKTFSSIQSDLVMVWWASSALLGCVATISKLLDYRYTAQKIKDGGAAYLHVAKWCGRVTWGCFWSQVITYAVGAWLFITGMAHI